MAGRPITKVYKDHALPDEVNKPTSMSKDGYSAHSRMQATAVSGCVKHSVTHAGELMPHSTMQPTRGIGKTDFAMHSVK